MRYTKTSLVEAFANDTDKGARIVYNMARAVRFDYIECERASSHTLAPNKGSAVEALIKCVLYKKSHASKDDGSNNQPDILESELDDSVCDEYSLIKHDYEIKLSTKRTMASLHTSHTSMFLIVNETGIYSVYVDYLATKGSAEKTRVCAEQPKGTRLDALSFALGFTMKNMLELGFKVRNFVATRDIIRLSDDTTITCYAPMQYDSEENADNYADFSSLEGTSFDNANITKENLVIKKVGPNGISINGYYVKCKSMQDGYHDMPNTLDIYINDKYQFSVECEEWVSWVQRKKDKTMEKEEMISGQSVSVKPYEIIDTINNKRYHTWKWYKLDGLFAVAHKLFKNIAWQLTYSEGGRVMTISKKA